MKEQASSLNARIDQLMNLLKQQTPSNTSTSESMLQLEIERQRHQLTERDLRLAQEKAESQGRLAQEKEVVVVGMGVLLLYIQKYPAADVSSLGRYSYAALCGILGLQERKRGRARGVGLYNLGEDCAVGT